jgi:hypothetical protein
MRFGRWGYILNMVLVEGAIGCVGLSCAAAHDDPGMRCGQSADAGRSQIK